MRQDAEWNGAERDAMEFLRRALPEADRISLGEDDLLGMVRHALRVRERMPWGRTIPEAVFRAFVLFPRVNDEDLEPYQEPIWRALKDRVAGKTMEEAVQEVNFWCCERAGYRSADDRTAGPLTLLRRTYGRCGEESTLLVSALRSVSIPARQMYVPRWSHCDDNHAWVEAWVDGRWRYLGACEPEPVLDCGWFTAAASKAMLVHTRAYGVAPEGERVEGAVGNAFILNRTAAYAETVLLTVRVTERGAPRPGLRVRFELANMAELYPINEQTTDANGEATLLTGRGTLRLHVHDGRRFLCAMVDTAEQTRCELDFAEAAETMAGAETFDQRPPLESRMQPAEFGAERLADHRSRLGRCEARLAARRATFCTGDEFVRGACGNRSAIEAFLALPQFGMEDKRALLGTLREKDLADATPEMLADALEGALPGRERVPRQVWLEGVLCPRVANEMLRPVRGTIRAWFAQRPADARALWRALEVRIATCAMEPEGLIPDPRAIWRAGRCSRTAMDVLFVTCARALGIAARLNPATGAKEFYDDGWQTLIPAQRPDAKLVLRNHTGRELHYGVHFTVGVLEGGAYRTLDLRGRTLTDELAMDVVPGRYRVVTCTRQADGAVDGWMAPAEVGAGQRAVVEVRMRPDRLPEPLVSTPLPPLRAWRDGEETVLPRAVRGRGAIFAFVLPGQEPTEHLLNELVEARGMLMDMRVAVRLLVDGRGALEDERLRQTVEALPDAQALAVVDPSEVLEWRRRLRAGELRFLFAAAVDAEGRGLFAFTNYNVGSVRSLLRMLEVHS